jgi:uncharacterized protein (DUF1810 family)
MVDRDSFDLSRFVIAQDGVFDLALSELRRGRKESHWMWFIFPQIAGLGRSPIAQRYALGSIEEAHAYLGHSILGPRLLECCRAILAIRELSASDILGYPDDAKLRSSMTLFALAAPAQPEFADVLEKYFEGRRDPRTLELLNVA